VLEGRSGTLELLLASGRAERLVRELLLDLLHDTRLLVRAEASEVRLRALREEDGEAHAGGGV
jgi:hypothetical protein